MDDVAAITEERYVSLTTFREDGSGRATPVWIAPGAEPGTAVFTTDPDSHKVRRMRRDPRVTLAPCDVRGEVEDGAPVVHGSAAVHVDDEVARDVLRRIGRKYGLQLRLLRLGRRIAAFVRREEPSSTAGIVITLEG